MTTSPTVLPPERYFDLVVIGAGPASLALVARILEERPAALYTEDEHRHLHWLRTSHRRSFIQTMRPGKGSDRFISGVRKSQMKVSDTFCDCDGVMRILVVDRVGSWMGMWKRLFKAFDIPYLRSPLFFHPAPFDLDALLAYAIRNPSRTCGGSITKSTRSNQPDLVEIPGCVGKELSKHKKKKSRSSAASAAETSMGPAVNERDRKDYYAASSQIFDAFVKDDVVRRYGLHGDFESLHAAFESGGKEQEKIEQREGATKAVMKVKSQVSSLDWGELHVEGWERLSGFCLELGENDMTCGGETIYIGAKAVVCATGAGAFPNIPQYLQSSLPSSSSKNAPSSPIKPFGEGWAHTSALGLPDFYFPPASLLDRERRGQRTSMVVIGGGLTSAQICDLALKRGISKVILILRGHLKVKPFDVGLEWMGRYSNLQKMRFWQEDDPEVRLRMIRGARNGGSITPNYVKILKAYEEQGRLDILTCTQIDEADYLATEPSDQTDGESVWRLRLTTTLNRKQQQRLKEQVLQTSKALGTDLSASTAESTTPSSKKKSKKKSLRKEVAAVPQVMSPSPTFSSQREAEPEEEHTDSSSSFSSRTSTMETSYIVAATGSAPSFSSLPFLHPFLSKAKYTEVGGLPLLNEGLQLQSSEESGSGASYPLFLVGGYSALQVGPGAFNLEGMRAAADRVAIRLAELANQEDDHSQNLPNDHHRAVNSSKVDHATMYLPSKQAKLRSPTSTAPTTVSSLQQRRDGGLEHVNSLSREPDKVPPMSAYSHFSFEMLEVGVES